LNLSLKLPSFLTEKASHYGVDAKYAGSPKDSPRSDEEKPKHQPQIKKPVVVNKAKKGVPQLKFGNLIEGATSTQAKQQPYDPNFAPKSTQSEGSLNSSGKMPTVLGVADKKKIS